MVEEDPERGAPVGGELPCANCGRRLTGPYCAHCGQAVRDLDQPIHELVVEWLGAVMAFDSRLLRTLSLLLSRPAALTQEFFAGRRVHYVHPLKLYFSMSLVLFIAMSLSGFSVVTVTSDEPVVAVGSTDAERAALPLDAGSPVVRGLSRIGALYVEDPARFNAVFIDRLSQVVFLLVTVFPVLLKLLYRRVLYVQHLVFSLHQHSFAFLALLAAIAVNSALGSTDNASSPAAAAVVVGYTFLAMRRFYGDSRARTALKLSALGIGYLASLVVTMIVALLLTSASM